MKRFERADHNTECSFYFDECMVMTKKHEVGLMLKPSRIDVRKIRKIPELANKTLHHWYHTVTYQNLSVKEIKFSVENADTLKLLDIEYSPIENVCDLDFDIV